MTLERIWAGWRSAYVSEAGVPTPGCVFCDIAASDDDEACLVLERAATTLTVMNLYPYTSGHLLVLPRRHVADLELLTEGEAVDITRAQQRAVVAVKAAYSPEGVNLGLNLGRAAGAGVPGHLHVHVLPRWAGDTNFMTSVAEARVLPEDLAVGFERLRAVWPREAR